MHTPDRLLTDATSWAAWNSDSKQRLVLPAGSTPLAATGEAPVTEVFDDQGCGGDATLTRCTAVGVGTKMGDGTGDIGSDGGGALGNITKVGVSDVVGRVERGDRVDRGERATNDEGGGDSGANGAMGLGGGETGGRRVDSGDVGVCGSDGGGNGEDEAREVRVDAVGKASGWRWARGAGMAYTVMVFSWSAAQHQQGMSRCRD